MNDKDGFGAIVGSDLLCVARMKVNHLCKLLIELLIVATKVATFTSCRNTSEARRGMTPLLKWST